ncbi:MAG: AMP-binding protein, partial [Fusobacteria bacterium]|nr:AMP-binding protein [Fusobacteriota bacterium]
MIENKKAIVIGKGNFCITCIEILKSQSWEIISVVAFDDKLKIYCLMHNINIINIKEIEKIDQTEYYLFSIFNPEIIKNSILKLKNNILTVNYHDSLLPKYGGINSTTWAILNDEKVHGITWHIVSEGIDEGDILVQKEVIIEENDSAFDLNMKCTKVGIEGFYDLLNMIENEKLIGKSQNLTKSEYYGLNKLPYNYGIISADTNKSLVKKLVRGLGFKKGYDNPITTIKCYVNGKFCIIADDINENKKKNDENHHFLDIYGNFIDDVIVFDDSENIKVSIDQLNKLSKIRISEYNFVKYLNRYRPLLENNSDLIINSRNKLKNNKIIKKTYVDFKEQLIVLQIIFSRLNTDEYVIPVYKLNEESTISEKLTQDFGVLFVKQKNLEDSFEEISLKFDKKNPMKTISKDCLYRYNFKFQSGVCIINSDEIKSEGASLVIKIKDGTTEFNYTNENAKIVEVISNSFEYLIKRVKEIRNNKTKTSCIPLINEEEFRKIIYEWNNTEADYPRDKTIQEMFEDQVSRTPYNIAVVYEDTELTYRALNDKANQLAHYLRREYSIQGDDLVALCLDRSELMLVSILGVLKSGAGYVPMDPEYPLDRYSHILSDTKTRVVLSN